MRVGRHLEHVIKTKGPVHTLERSLQVLYRFARGRKHFDRMIERLETELPGVRITFCSAASLLASHRDAFDRLDQAGHELAAHGYFHSRMDYLDFDGQSRILDESHREFERAGFEVTGFRCPYLNFNQDTIDALQKSPYAWTSQEIVFWTNNGRHPATRRLDELYHTRKSNEQVSIPFQRGKLLEIPITAPDDEMLVERMRIREPRDITRIWKQVFQTIYEQGELCHLLFHPERFNEIAGGLRAVVDLAREQPRDVWFATIGEVSAWWRERQSAHYSLERCEAGWGLNMNLPPRATLLLKQPDSKPQSRFYRDYVVSEAAAGKDQTSHFKCLGKKEPAIRVSAGCASWIKPYLKSEGFLLSDSSDSESRPLEITPDNVGRQENRRQLLEFVESSGHPLFRIWRWPDGARAALTISADVDSITLIDFWRRMVNF